MASKRGASQPVDYPVGNTELGYAGVPLKISKRKRLDSCQCR